MAIYYHKSGDIDISHKEEWVYIYIIKKSRCEKERWMYMILAILVVIIMAGLFYYEEHSKEC